MLEKLFEWASLCPYTFILFEKQFFVCFWSFTNGRSIISTLKSYQRRVSICPRKSQSPEMWILFNPVGHSSFISRSCLSITFVIPPPHWNSVYLASLLLLLHGSVIRQQHKDHFSLHQKHKWTVMLDLSLSFYSSQKVLKEHQRDWGNVYR